MQGIRFSHARAEKITRIWKITYEHDVLIASKQLGSYSSQDTVSQNFLFALLSAKFLKYNKNKAGQMKRKFFALDKILSSIYNSGQK